MDSTNQEQRGTAVFTIDKSAYKWILAVQAPAVQGLSGFMQKKKKPSRNSTHDRLSDCALWPNT